MTDLRPTDIEEKWQNAKEEYPECLILFVVGDFHETFGLDAQAVAKIIGLTVTERKIGNLSMSMVGFPNHSADGYIAKLVKAGHRVVICEEA